MLAQNVGWARTSGMYGRKNLLWTDDGGAHWKDITPNPFPSSGIGIPPAGFHTVPETMEDVFFLDKHTGWVLFCCGQENADLPRYDLAMTTDSGASWSIARVTIPKDVSLQTGMDVYGGAIAFADSVHGWMNLTESAGHSAGGTLLITSDGGRSWHPAEDGPPGGAGPFCLVTAIEGWQLTTPTWNDPDTTGLSVTRDGARSWHQVSMPIPKEIHGVAGFPPETKYYDLPTFEDSKHGFIPVTYEEQEPGGKLAIVLFETVDGGRTWKPVRTIKDLSEDHDLNIVDVADSTLLVATGSRGERRAALSHATLSKDGPKGRTDVDISNYVAGQQGIYGSQLSFVTASEGWMLNDGKLLSTTDGGASWITLTPVSQEREATPDLFKPDVAIDSMQLLTPDIGWVLSLRHRELDWTEDGGTTWKTIAPPSGMRGPREILSAFFLDTKRGWALFHTGSDFEVFSTIDAGAHWTIMNVVVPDLDLRFSRYGYRLSGHIYFVDAVNGWMSLDVAGDGHNDQQGKILITSDGGQTWEPRQTETRSAGNIRLVSTSEAWQRSTSGDELFVTRDGAHNWKRVSLAPPNEVYPAINPTYDLPIFEDSKHGFLPVTYSGGLGVKAAAVLFVTDDGGRTWMLNRMLTNLNGMPVGNEVSSAMVGPSWITASKAEDNNPTLTTLGSGGKVNVSSDAGPGYYGAYQLSFVNQSRGWVLLSDGRLVSTSDGGATWAALSPVRSWQVPISALRRPRPQSASTRVVSMQLVSPEVGAVTLDYTAPGEQTELRVFRTDSGGAQWKEISPSLSAGEQIVSTLFFLDGKHGWVVVLRQEQSSSESSEYANTFELLSTTDAGASWSSTPMEISELESQKGFIRARGQISFVDSLHGWMNMNVFVVPNWKSSWDKTLTTADGGKTWNAGTDNPVVRAPEVRFVTPMEAWMVSDPAPVPVRETTIASSNQYGNELYVTRDGAKSWQEASFDPPKEVYLPDGSSYPPPTRTCGTHQPSTGQMTYPPPSPIYGLPTFTDSEHGFLPVTYSALSAAKYADGMNCRSFHYHAVLFATGDGGRTWKLDRMYFSNPEVGLGCDSCTVLSSMEGPTWVLLNHSSTNLPSLTTLATGAKVDVSRGVGDHASYAGYDSKGIFWEVASGWPRLELATPSTVWIMWNYGLLSTSNGGDTLTDITPKLDLPVATDAAP
jgi:photosystem II stability/assembly factor-like uncharacterized protein